MRNLLTNALNSTERAVCWYRHERAMASCFWRCGTPGVGIAAEHIPHLFEPFYQVNNRARDRRKGLGLGLAVAKRLADLLGHPLAVRSRPGRGTVAKLVVPTAEQVVAR